MKTLTVLITAGAPALTAGPAAAHSTIAGCDPFDEQFNFTGRQVYVARVSSF